MSMEEKYEVAAQLARLGVDIIEAGFPVSSPHQFEACKLISQKVKGPVIAALARAVEKDIDIAYESVKDAEKKRIHTFLATSHSVNAISVVAIICSIKPPEKL